MEIQPAPQRWPPPITSNNPIMIGVCWCSVGSPIMAWPQRGPPGGLARACARPGGEVIAGNRRQGGQRPKKTLLWKNSITWWILMVKICWNMLNYVEMNVCCQEFGHFFRRIFVHCLVLFVGVAAPCSWISGRDGCLPSSRGPWVVATRDASWSCLCLGMSPKIGFKHAIYQNISK